MDELCADAPDQGAALLVADFPRAYVDANRKENDLNPDLVDGDFGLPLDPSVKTTLGIGLIREKVANGASIYARRLSPAEVRKRIETYHRPYHHTLGDLLNATRRQFGLVYHLDMHSMASHANAVTPDGGGKREFDMVLGDLDGTACEPGLTDLAYTTLADLGYRVRVNDPYKGAYISRRYGRPEQGTHTLQIEMNRALYLDESTIEKNAQFYELRKSLSVLFSEVAGYAASQTKSEGEKNE